MTTAYLLGGPHHGDIVKVRDAQNDVVVAVSKHPTAFAFDATTKHQYDQARYIRRAQLLFAKDAFAFEWDGIG